MAAFAPLNADFRTPRQSTSEVNMDRRVFVFVFSLKPTASAPHAGKVGKVIADVWVHGPSEAESEISARAFVMEYGYQVLAVEDRRVMNEEAMFRYREDAQASFRQAIKHGISGSFASAPPVDREDNTVEIHRMAVPHPSSGSKH